MIKTSHFLADRKASTLIPYLCFVCSISPVQSGAHPERLSRTRGTRS